MPRVSTIQTNFTAGELSPKVRGRVDVARYQNGAESLANCLVDIYGGARRAPGTRFIASAWTASVRSRLIPFIYNRTNAYHLEFADHRVRVVRAGAGLVLGSGGSPYQIVSPYSNTQIQDVRYVQAADTMFLAHPDFPIYMLRRVAEDNWQMTPAPFSVTPFAEVGHVFVGTSLSLNSASVGNGRTFTASGSVFLASDVGRRLTYLTGVGFITAVTATTATVTITVAFPTTTIPAGQWRLEDSPQTSLQVSAKGIVGQAITMNLGAAGWRNPEDIGSYVRVNGGLVQIASIDSTGQAGGVVRQDLDSNADAPAGAWSLLASVWGGLNGYPSAVAINQQRLIAGGNRRFPNGVWGSRTGIYFDFTLGDDDTDAFFYALDGESNGIEHLASVRALLALTPGTEWTMVGGVEKPMTPTNVQAKDQSVYGCNTAKPVRIGDELVFTQRAGRKVRAMGYRVESDSYAAPDLTTLAEHVTVSGVVEMTYQQEPGSVLWCVLANGKLAALTIDRDEGVTAWTPHDTDGFYESVSAAPVGDRDEVIAVVRREVNGQTVRYLERFDPDYYVHSGIEGSNPGGAATWSGLSHLEGKTVTVLADGSPQGDFVVSGGQITLARNANTVQIGLKCVPRVKLLRPELNTPSGTAQSNKMRAHKLSFLFLNTSSGYANGQPLPFRTFGAELLDKPPPMFTGWKSIGELSWDDGEMEVELTQPDPLPFHLLAVVRHWTSNE